MLGKGASLTVDTSLGSPRLGVRSGVGSKLEGGYEPDVGSRLEVELEGGSELEVELEVGSELEVELGVGWMCARTWT